MIDIATDTVVGTIELSGEGDDNLLPLIRLDGYYLLSDWLEIPNLRIKSTQFFAYLFQEKVLGLEVPVQSYMPRSRRFLFVTYAVASYFYRWFVTFSILFFIYQFLKPYKLVSRELRRNAERFSAARFRSELQTFIDAAWARRQATDIGQDTPVKQPVDW